MTSVMFQNACLRQFGQPLYYDSIDEVGSKFPERMTLFRLLEYGALLYYAAYSGGMHSRNRAVFSPSTTLRKSSTSSLSLATPSVVDDAPVTVTDSLEINLSGMGDCRPMENAVR